MQPPPHSQRDGFPKITAAAYLLLSGVYLLYWSHVEYFVDDWILLGHHRRAGFWEFAADTVQNRIYGVFRMQWLSILYGFVVSRLGGDSAQFNYAWLLALHAVNSWLLCQALWRLGLERGLSFLAGAFFLLAPTSHFVLFTYLTNPFFVFSLFWVLLMLWWSAGTGRRQAVWLCCCAVAGLFSGEQAFLLLWAAIPLAVWCFRRAAPGPRTIAAVWAAVGASAGVYLLWINRLPIREVGLSRRYEWTWRMLENNVALIFSETPRLSGLTGDSFFRIAPEPVEAILALVASMVVAALIWKWSAGEPAGQRLWRVWLFAAIGAVLAYGPTLWLAGGYPLRYHYAPSPFLALAAAAACWVLAGSAAARKRRQRLAPALVGGLATGFLTLNAAADLRQCWIPQSGHYRLLKARLQKMEALAPGDILIIAGTPYQIGTAQHFAMHSPDSAGPFAESVTGVRPLEVSRELLQDHDALALYQRWNHHRPIGAADLERAHVLVFSKQGTFSEPEWAAVEPHPGSFRLLPLKGTADPTVFRNAIFSREQLAFMHRNIYFAKPASSYQPE